VSPDKLCMDIMKIGFSSCAANLTPYNMSKFSDDTKHLGFIEGRNFPVRALISRGPHTSDVSKHVLAAL